MDSNAIGERIKELREQNKLSQNELAKLIGVSRSSCNSWEIGMNLPTALNLIALSKQFNCTVDYLLGLENEQVISVRSLTPEQKNFVYMTVEFLKESN